MSVAGLPLPSDNICPQIIGKVHRTLREATAFFSLQLSAVNARPHPAKKRWFPTVVEPKEASPLMRSCQSTRQQSLRGNKTIMGSVTKSRPDVVTEMIRERGIINARIITTHVPLRKSKLTHSLSHFILSSPVEKKNKKKTKIDSFYSIFIIHVYTLCFLNIYIYTTLHV